MEHHKVNRFTNTQKEKLYSRFFSHIKNCSNGFVIIRNVREDVIRFVTQTFFYEQNSPLGIDR